MGANWGEPGSWARNVRALGRRTSVRANMIISGGENVILRRSRTCSRPRACEAAADPKWGERAHAVMVLNAGVTLTEDLAW